MDVDPKPQNDQSPTPPDEPDMMIDKPMSDDSDTQMNNNEPKMDDAPKETQPADMPNPAIAAALEDEMVETPEETEPQTQSMMTNSPAPTPTPMNEKKSRKPLVIGIVVIVLIVIAGLAVYVLFGVPKSDTASDATKTDGQNTATPATDETSTEKIDAAVEAIDTNATEEATASDTDDSTEATDASASAGNVGDSINEDDF